jgi:hypothetical protein
MGKNFNLRIFKLHMELTSMDLWSIMDKSKKTASSNIDLKVKKDYKRHAKKVMSIVTLNLADEQLADIISCKRPMEA